MQEARTISQVLERLQRKGYVENFKACKNGMRVIPMNIFVDPEFLIVDEIFRFEGETDLDEEAIIFALRCPKNNLKGTYLVAFGPMMDAQDVAVVAHLHHKYKNKSLS
jgi:ribosomal protein S8